MSYSRYWMSCASTMYFLTRWSWKGYQGRSFPRDCLFILWLFPKRVTSKYILRRGLLSLPSKLPSVEKDLSSLSTILGFVGIALPFALLTAATQSTLNLISGINRYATLLSSRKFSMIRSINCQKSIICSKHMGNSNTNTLHTSSSKSLVTISKPKYVKYSSNFKSSWQSKNKTSFHRWLHW